MSTIKILLPYRDSCDREITSSVVSGGGEQFCKLINKNFINVEVLQVPSKAEQSWSVKESGAPVTKAEIKTATSATAVSFSSTTRAMMGVKIPTNNNHDLHRLDMSFYISFKFSFIFLYYIIINIFNYFCPHISISHILLLILRHLH